MIDEALRNLIDDAVAVRIGCGIVRRRCFDTIQRAVENHAGRGHHPPPSRGSRQVGVDDFEPHLVLHRAGDEFADGDRSAVREEWPDS